MTRAARVSSSSRSAVARRSGTRATALAACDAQGGYQYALWPPVRTASGREWIFLGRALGASTNKQWDWVLGWTTLAVAEVPAGRRQSGASTWLHQFKNAR